jgi:hypothetical protein
MKKKVLLSALAALALALTLTVARSDDEGNPGGNCLAPFSNICFQVVKSGVVVYTVQGVLHI